MTGRERLPNRRRCETRDLDYAGHRFTLTTGYSRDGRIAEIFISSSKPGSPIEAIARDAAVTVFNSVPILRPYAAHSLVITMEAPLRCWAPLSIAWRCRDENNSAIVANLRRPQTASPQGGGYPAKRTCLTHGRRQALARTLPARVAMISSRQRRAS
jgi:hypothetical protein